MVIGKKFKSFLPDAARDYLYTFHQNSRLRRERQRRKCIFDTAIKQFITNPKEILNSQNGVLADLIYGWANEQWSALDKYLEQCLKHALITNGPILECGSGLTTILLGIIAETSGNSVWSLEHTPAWAAKVEKYLNKYRISTVRLCLRPLKNYGDFTWYDPPLADMPKTFSMVVCDGPPAGTNGGRFGLLPIMKNRLKQGSVILLDDADREHENSIALRWATELNAELTSFGTVNPYIIITVPQVRSVCKLAR